VMVQQLLVKGIVPLFAVVLRCSWLLVVVSSILEKIAKRGPPIYLNNHQVWIVVTTQSHTF
jgi:hypothetical protein